MKKLLLILFISLGVLTSQAQDYKGVWSVVSGNEGVTFVDKTDPKSEVTFAKAGTYILRYTIIRGEQTQYDDVIIHVEEPPQEPEEILLPIEVLGENGYIQEVVFNHSIQESVNRAYFKTHNVTYDDKMQFSINDGPWIKVKNTNVEFRKMDHITGGFGGGHMTHAFYINFPDTEIKENNTVKFKFYSRPQERSSGYRVLDFHFVNGFQKIPNKPTFVKDDPTKWIPIHTSQESINKGKELWETKVLVDPATFPNGETIKATCADCHPRDGRDLQYFNYSNKSIVARSVFHGTTEEEGELIASYIRTLPFKSKNGRPWNPPYQPAKGLDSLGVSEWAAGGGEEAVLDDFEAMYEYLFPESVEDDVLDINKVSGDILDIDKIINIREMPIPFQLPDWNSWLPSIHPLDSTGDFFLNHPVYRRYLSMREMNSGHNHENWFFYQNDLSNYTKIDNWPNYPATNSHNLNASERHSLETYDAALWGITKAWEIMQEKNQEGVAIDYFSEISSIAEGPSWYTNTPFFVSPNMLGLPHENHGIRNNSKETRFYFAYIWYHLQAILYAGQGVGNPITPLDHPYVWGFLVNMPFSLDKSKYAVESFPLHFLWVMKITQLMNNGQLPNNKFDNSPQFNLVSPKVLVGSPSIEHYYYQDEGLYKKMLDIHLNQWLNLVGKYTPDQLRLDDRIGDAVGFTYPPDQAGINNLFYSSNFLKELFYVAHKYNKLGLNSTVDKMKNILIPAFNQQGIPWEKFGK